MQKISQKIINFIGKIKKYKLRKIVTVFLSFVVFFLTIYLLMQDGMTLNDSDHYTFYLKDSYNYSWKDDLNKEFNLKLYFMDNFGNYIEGTDITLEISDDVLLDDPYGFGYVPINGESTRGKDLLKELELDEYTLTTGEKYLFDHAEVLIDGVWQKFLSTSDHWDIWCQSSSSVEAASNYGWRGKYGDNISYTITNETEYKLVYKNIRYGMDKSVSSLDGDSGITFKMFDYVGDNNETLVNANGLYNYFSFRGLTGDYASYINPNTDADGFTDNRAKVLPNLVDNYPVFDCREYCENKSLGYLFGSKTNALKTETIGVLEYLPSNTLLQKETLNNVEYYYYDSNRNAVDYDIENNQFLLRDYVERGYNMSGYPLESERYEFMPFNYWNDNEKIKTITDSSFTYNYEKADINHWFGMTMEFNFYMPKNGTINGEDMIFSFSGDDDVWVFVDNVLVLDLGGTHGAVDGNINFKTGEVKSYLNWNNTISNENTTTIYDSYVKANAIDTVSWNDSKNTYEDYTLHNVKFFYLERGAGVSNCKIRFNIPVLPSGSLSVQKAYEGITNYDDDYEFIIYDITNDEKTIVKDIDYTVGDMKYHLDSSGVFTLKKDQVAVFKLTNYHEYYVMEKDPKSHSISFKCSLNGNLCSEVNKTDAFIIKPDSFHQAIFTNKFKTYDLKITKEAYTTDLDDFTFKVFMENKDNSLEEIEFITKNEYVFDKNILDFTLQNEESILIKNIPIDTKIKLEETFYDGYDPMIKSGEVVLSNSNEYEFIIDSDKEITVINIPGVMLPETGGSGIKNYLIVGIMCLLSSFYGIGYLLKRKEGG